MPTGSNQSVAVRDAKQAPMTSVETRQVGKSPGPHADESHDPEFDRIMRVAYECMEEYHDALRELAKR